jgi:endonuclease YncB( thermonuclease family)
MLRICSLFVFAALFAVPLAAQDFSGQMRFSDADTLRVGSVKVRVFGIDAPEMAQTCQHADGTDWACGRWSADQASALFDGKWARCQQKDVDQYGRIVATCFFAGRDIAETLVERGIATAYRDFSLDYIDAEKRASIPGKGIWEGTLQTPSEYRATNRNPPQAVPGDCTIKGNISGSGKIFHVPGQRDYDATQINTAKGERWFCTRSEAIAAGWRAAGR